MSPSVWLVWTMAPQLAPLCLLKCHSGPPCIMHGSCIVVLRAAALISLLMLLCAAPQGKRRAEEGVPGPEVGMPKIEVLTVNYRWVRCSLSSIPNSHGQLQVRCQTLAAPG